MGRSKYFSKGDVQRYVECEKCDKKFSGDARDVVKLISMHYKYSHGLEFETYTEKELGRDVHTRELLLGGMKITN